MYDIHVVAAENQTDALARMLIVAENRQMTILHAGLVGRAALEDLRDYLVGADIGPKVDQTLFCIVARIR